MAYLHTSSTRLNVGLIGLAFLTLVLAASCTARGSGSYRATYVASYGDPPPPRVVVVDERPGYVWVDGRWAWGGSGWVWYDGYWVEHRPGYVWVQGRWYNDRGRWVWHDGRWHAHGRGNAVVRDRGPTVHDHRTTPSRVKANQPARVKVKGGARVRVKD
jgi:hypothetical protein